MKFLNVLLLFLFFSISAISQNPIITTHYGKIKGYVKEDLHIFKKIPFASPPVGSLRWKAPLEPQKWEGILDCTSFAASPMQREPKPFSCWTEEFIAPPEPLSEDCLYLNIWTKPNQTKKPVVLWIYGGGFNSGSAACAIYDGKYYAKQDIVFVSINYRVNIFGFFAHPEITAESKGEGAANFGLLDQLQALKWIKENISGFGGDPENVTIMGQSAGSFSVHALVASPLAKGLFNKAIAHSGGILGNNRGVSLAIAEENGKKFASQVNSKSLAELKALSANALLENANKFNPPYGPVLDGYFLPTDIDKHYKMGLHNQVKVLTGWVTGDGALFGSPKIQPEIFKKQVELSYKNKAANILNYFPYKTEDEASNSNSKLRRLSFGGVSAILWAKNNRLPVYIYEFDHVPASKENFPDYGAFHTADVPFALHSLDTWKRNWREVDLNVEGVMSQYWINFIKTGNPNSQKLIKWKPYTNRQKAILNLNEKPRLINKMYAAEFDAIIGE